MANFIDREGISMPSDVIAQDKPNAPDAFIVFDSGRAFRKFTKPLEDHKNAQNIASSNLNPFVGITREFGDAILANCTTHILLRRNL